MKKLLPEVCTIQYGFPFDSAKFSDSNGMPLIRIRDVVRGYSETYTTEEYKSEYIVHENDLLIGMDGEFNIAKWGKTPALLNQRVCRLAPNDSIDKDYLFYFMPIALKRIEEKTPFVTVKHLSAKELNKIEIPILPLEEQRKIAETLSKVDELIAFRDRQLAKLDELVKARFVEMFGDPISNPFGFKVESLQEMLDDNAITYHLDGNHGSDYPRNEEFVESGVSYISANCIIDDNVNLQLAKHLTEERAAKLRKGIAQDEDVLFAHNATVGPVAILHTRETKVVLGTSLTAYRCNKQRILPSYLKAYMQSEGFVRQYTKDMKQTTRNQVPITAQRKYLFIVPPLSLQNRFASFVERIDQQKQTVQQSLEKLELMKKALMQEYFG